MDRISILDELAAYVDQRDVPALDAIEALLRKASRTYVSAREGEGEVLFVVEAEGSTTSKITLPESYKCVGVRCDSRVYYSPKLRIYVRMEGYRYRVVIIGGAGGVEC